MVPNGGGSVKAMEVAELPRSSCSVDLPLANTPPTSLVVRDGDALAGFCQTYEIDPSSKIERVIDLDVGSRMYPAGADFSVTVYVPGTTLMRLKKPARLS